MESTEILEISFLSSDSCHKGMLLKITKYPFKWHSHTIRKRLLKHESLVKTKAWFVRSFYTVSIEVHCFFTKDICCIGESQHTEKLKWKIALVSNGKIRKCGVGLFSCNKNIEISFPVIFNEEIMLSKFFYHNLAQKVTSGGFSPDPQHGALSLDSWVCALPINLIYPGTTHVFKCSRKVPCPHLHHNKSFNTRNTFNHINRL